MTDLAKLRALVDDEDGCIRGDKLDELGVDNYKATWLKPDDPIPQPLICPYCDAVWTPEMFEILELSGYCPTCADSEQVIDVFCSSCTRLVYRKTVSV